MCISNKLWTMLKLVVRYTSINPKGAGWGGAVPGRLAQLGLHWLREDWCPPGSVLKGQEGWVTRLGPTWGPCGGAFTGPGAPGEHKHSGVPVLPGYPKPMPRGFSSLEAYPTLLASQGCGQGAGHQGGDKLQKAGEAGREEGRASAHIVWLGPLRACGR